jgi:hypothetical protein
MTSAAWARAYLASRPDVVGRFSACQIEDLIGVIAAARDETLRHERERCIEHLTLARASGHLDVGYQAVSDGVSVDSMRAKYMDLATAHGGLGGAYVHHALLGEVSS